MNEENTFLTVKTMLQTLQTVALDELRSQGNEVECAVALCEVVRVSGELYQYVDQQQTHLVNRILSKMHLETE